MTFALCHDIDKYSRKPEKFKKKTCRFQKNKFELDYELLFQLIFSLHQLSIFMSSLTSCGNPNQYHNTFLITIVLSMIIFKA